MNKKGFLAFLVLALILIISAAAGKGCSCYEGQSGACVPGCDWSQVGDRNCDPACNVYACAFDGHDCEGGLFCAPGCDESWVGDKECDQACFNAACNYDGGDCAVSTPYATSSYCAAGCPSYYIGDGWCDNECNNAACNYDGGDCSSQSGCSAGYYPATNAPSVCCPSGYPYYWASDGSCHSTAWTAPTATQQGSTCDAPGCSWEEFNNDVCDLDCVPCNCDNGHCPQSYCSWCAVGCPDDWRGDGHCDAGCNNAACDYDWGDCN